MDDQQSIGGNIICYYKQVKISAAPDVANAFKKACAMKDISMAKVLSEFMADFSNSALNNGKPLPDYTTKRKRRAAIKSIIHQLEAIKIAEELYRDNIPTNLQNSAVFDSAEESVSLLEETIDSLCSF